MSITINTQSRSATRSGINLYALEQSDFIGHTYRDNLSITKGTLTTEYTNDLDDKFERALVVSNPNRIQKDVLNQFKDEFIKVEEQIDPNKLYFDIYKSRDGEICLGRISDYGFSEIIIHEDGLIAYSFIAGKGIPKNDVLDFWDESNLVDFEKLSYMFLSK